MGAGTGAGSDTTYNDCNIAYGHAYSVLAAFQMTDASNVVHDMLMLRNPWGITNYNGNWHKGDTAWTAALIAQVPFGTNPTTSDSDGIFFMTAADFIKTDTAGDGTGSAYSCITNFEISHYRASEGYSNDYYDLMSTNEAEKTYYFVTPPNSDGDLYFTAETYYQEMVPSECIGASN